MTETTKEGGSSSDAATADTVVTSSSSSTTTRDEDINDGCESEESSRMKKRRKMVTSKDANSDDNNKNDEQNVEQDDITMTTLAASTKASDTKTKTVTFHPELDDGGVGGARDTSIPAGGSGGGGSQQQRSSSSSTTTTRSSNRTTESEEKTTDTSPSWCWKRPLCCDAELSPEEIQRRILMNRGDGTNSTKNEYDNIRWIIVRNDGRSESMIKLVGLKSLFAKQLPKMPRAYIARLVFDRRHTSLAILRNDVKQSTASNTTTTTESTASTSNQQHQNGSTQPAAADGTGTATGTTTGGYYKDSDEEIIGGICYRAFPEMRLGEIAFCAVNANHQVKGYGTKLMNILKQIAVTTGIEYFITYADNYAIGYFKKQGFTKTISMYRGRYYGLIKDYDGGTPMECYVHPSIDYMRINEMLNAQRKFILDRIQRTSASKNIYPPLPPDFAHKFNTTGGSGSGGSTNFLDNNSSAGGDGSATSTSSLRANHAAARAMSIPGIVEAGWTMADLVATTGLQGKETDRQKTALKNELLGIIRKIEEQQFAWPFREPVDVNEVPDYLNVIKVPIDLSTIEKRIKQENCTHYKSKQMLFADLMLMVNNCKLYNDESSTYVQCACSLEKYLTTTLNLNS